MRKKISLLLALLLLLSICVCVLSEDSAQIPPDDPEEADGDDSVQIPLDDLDDTDGDDSVQLPLDDLDLDEEEGDGAVLELRTLAIGDEGDDVLYLQLRLKSLRYEIGETDGIFGPGTEAAVLKFQQDNAASGLDPTGIADVATQILLASARYRTLRYGSEGDDVKDLQTRLTALGYYTGKISGKFLEGSENGIKQLQKNNGLEVTGVADPLTQEVLYSADAVGRHDVEDPTPTPFSDLSYYLVDESESGVPMPDEPVAFSSELKKGSKGEAVKLLQERMQLLGYFDGPISGNYQDKSVKAVKKIQEQNGLPVTGKVDEATWNLIFNDPGLVLPDQTPKPSPTPEPVPFAITVDVKNQIVSVYTRDEDGNYTVPVKQMLCSTGKVGTDSPLGDWVLNGRKAKWCYFPKWGDYARYWTRINAQVAFHSPIYSATSTKAMKTASYKALGNRASHGCIRLSVPDAKWIYDNVGAGTVVTITNSLPVDKELKEALKLPASPDDPHTPEPEMPSYSSSEKPDLKGATLYEGSRDDAVYWVQCRLKELGYYTTMCTGHMLNRTVQAVKDFQRDHGFYQSGSVNQQLIDAMAEAEKITPTPEPLPDPTLTPAP